MKFCEALEKIKDTGGIITDGDALIHFAAPKSNWPIIMLDENCVPLEIPDEELNANRNLSKWILWEPSPDEVLRTDWKVKEVFSPERKKYFSSYGH